ncbi:hypothetical protein AVEN_16945-1 [Araneus ventricosus]|uniref:Uncharacterized protein n=1 Tax=Araneus ventricosus TaxID=182803 RepID=A0A4Y2D5S9_ARAVE|nr:hypothetical protein AVEN_16945-1 [Araneus ventricosus]
MFQITPQPKIIRIKIRLSWRTMCWKVTADNPIISEMHADQPLNRIADVGRSAVLHENCDIHTRTLLKCGNDVVSQNRFIEYTIEDTGNRTRRALPPGKRMDFNVPQLPHVFQVCFIH